MSLWSVKHIALGHLCHQIAEKDVSESHLLTTSTLVLVATDSLRWCRYWTSCNFDNLNLWWQRQLPSRALVTSTLKISGFNEVGFDNIQQHQFTRPKSSIPARELKKDKPSNRKKKKSNHNDSPSNILWKVAMSIKRLWRNQTPLKGIFKNWRSLYTV